MTRPALPRGPCADCGRDLARRPSGLPVSHLCGPAYQANRESVNRRRRQKDRAAMEELESYRLERHAERFVRPLLPAATSPANVQTVVAAVLAAFHTARAALLLLVILCGASSVAAEENPLKWGSHRPIADWVSTGLVGVNVAGDVITTWRADDKRQAWLGLVCRDAIAIGVSELVKRIIHRTRPDGSDRMSMPSEHTAVAVATGGWSIGVGYTVAIAVGDLRGAADKHHLSDIGVGFGLGLVARQVCPS